MKSTWCLHFYLHETLGWKCLCYVCRIFFSLVWRRRSAERDSLNASKTWCLKVDRSLEMEMRRYSKSVFSFIFACLCVSVFQVKYCSTYISTHKYTHSIWLDNVSHSLSKRSILKIFLSIVLFSLFSLCGVQKSLLPEDFVPNGQKQ